MLVDLNHLKEMGKNTLVETLGMDLLVAEKGKVIMTMPVDARTHQPMGLLHGGASVALAESAASIGANIVVAEEGKVAVGQEINANHVRSLREGVVRAEAVMTYQGRTSQVWEINIFDNETNKLVCISRCTLAILSN